MTRDSDTSGPEYAGEGKPQQLSRESAGDEVRGCSAAEADQPDRHSEGGYHLLYSAVSALMQAEAMDEGLHGFLRAVCPGLGADYGAVWLVTPASEQLGCAAIWHTDVPELQTFAIVNHVKTFLRGAGLLGRVWASGEAMWTDDLGAGDDFQRDALATSAGLRQAYYAPIAIDGSVTGVIELCWRSTSHVDDTSRTHHLMDMLAPQLGQFVRRVRGQHGRDAKTEREHLRLQQALTRVLVDSVTMEEGLQRVLGAACEGLGWQLGALWQVDDAQEQLRFTTAWHSPDVEAAEFETNSRVFAFRPGRGTLGSAWQTGKPIWVEDVAEATHFARAALIAAMGIRSAIAVPILMGGKVVAILEFLSRERRRTDATLLSLLEAVGAQVGLFVERKRAEDTLKANEQRWATTLTSIGDAVIATDTAGRVTFMNPVAQALTGWAYSEAAYRLVPEVFNIVNEVTRQRVDDPVSKVLDSGLVVGLANHTILVRRDGTEVAIDDSGAPIRDEGGRTQGVVLVFRDITERRRAEEALHQSEERFAIILQGVADGITAQRGDGQLVYANDTAARLVGFANVQEMLDSRSNARLDRFEILDETGQPAELDQLPGRVALRTGRRAESIVRFRSRGSNEEHWSIDKAVPVFNAQGQAEMAVNIFHDITPLKRAEQALSAALELTRELYSSSHDIGMASTADDVLRVLLSTHYLRDTSHALITIYDHHWTAESGVPESIDVLATYTRPDIGHKAMPVTVGMHLPAPSMLIDELQLRSRPWMVGNVAHEQRVNEQQRAGLAVYGIQALAVFPLIANGANFGVAAFYFDSIKMLSSDDVRHIQGLVDQVAVAVSNHLSLEKETRARQQAVRAAERVTRLQRLTAALTTPLGLDEVADVILQEGALAIGAYAGSVVLLSEDGEMLEVVKTTGYPPEAVADWQRFPVSLPTAPLAVAVREGKPVWIESAQMWQHRTGALHEDRSRSWAALPLSAQGRVIGGLGWSFETERSFDQEERNLILALAHQCGQALERARLYEAEAHARRDAERASELRLKFLAMISHELRTPLTPIKGLTTSLLARDVQWSPDEQRDFLAIIDQETDKLTEMIEQLLDLSRLEAGLLSIHRQPEALDDILATASPQLQEIAKRHVWQLDVHSGLPRVNADRKRVAQVLANLVGNAAKYAPQGSTITVSARQVEGYLQLNVRDEGPGIPAAQRPFVFQAFHRGDDNVARQTKGAGLGLAICKGIVEAHGGNIWIQDAEPDKPGTTICFTLPAIPE